jgi:hypothetical protein
LFVSRTARKVSTCFTSKASKVSTLRGRRFGRGDRGQQGCSRMQP